jgi:hypothetical protein
MPRRDPAKAVQVLDAMLEFFDGGRRWARGTLRDQYGQRCLIGALRHIRQQQRIRRAGTEHYLRDALQQLAEHSYGVQQIDDVLLLHLHLLAWKPERNDVDLMGFNDGSAYDEVREVIVEARAIAQAEVDAKRVRRRTTKLTPPVRNENRLF